MCAKSVRGPRDLDATLLPVPGAQSEAAVPDKGLSAAMRSALGARPGESHPATESLIGGNALAKQAKSARQNSSSRPSAARKGHIGPRSGHK